MPAPDRHTDAAALRAAAVTVVTVCRNPGKLLEQAIASVAALRRDDVAHVVIDGASSDGTQAYLRAMPTPIAPWWRLALPSDRRVGRRIIAITG